MVGGYTIRTQGQNPRWDVTQCWQPPTPLPAVHRHTIVAGPSPLTNVGACNTAPLLTISSDEQRDHCRLYLLLRSRMLAADGADVDGECEWRRSWFSFGTGKMTRDPGTWFELQSAGLLAPLRPPPPPPPGSRPSRFPLPMVF